MDPGRSHDSLASMRLRTGGPDMGEVQMNQTLATCGVVAACVVSAATAEFETPTVSTEGWDREVTAFSTYAEWDVFSSPVGPNAPDVGAFVGGVLPEEALPFDAYDADEIGGSFITSGGNIYSFSTNVAPRIEIPGFGLGPGHSTTILVQFRTLGSVFSPETALLNGTVLPEEIVELDIQPLSGFGGGVQADMLVRFELDEDLTGYVVDFTASATSMSLDRIAVDTFVRPSGCGAADLAVPLGTLDIDDVLTFLGAFAAGEPAADLAAPEGALDIDDVLTFLGSFAEGCPS